MKHRYKDSLKVKRLKYELMNLQNKTDCMRVELDDYEIQKCGICGWSDCEWIDEG